MPSYVPETGFCAAINPPNQILKVGMEIFGSIFSLSVFKLLLVIVASHF